MLRERNIAVYFEVEKIITLKDGEFLLTILSSVAQQEVENTSAYVKKGLKMKMKHGELVGFQGCLGYDYDVVTKSLSINEEGAETVRYIFDRYVAGAGSTMIARELNEHTPIRNLLIEKGEIFEIHSGTSEAFTLAGNVVDFTIQDNEVHDVENIGIIIAGGDNLNPKGDISVNYARNGVVRRNKVYRCTHEKSQDYWSQSVSNGGAIGIYLCGNGNTIVEQNEVFECDRGIGLCSESYKLQTKDCIVRDNFVYNNFRTGIYMGAYLGFDGLSTKNCYVVNNTLFNNNLKGGQLDGTNNYLKVNDRDNSSEGEIRLSELCEGNVIANNIIYAVSDRDIFIRKYTTSGKNNYIGGNIYFSPTKKNHKWIWDGKEYTDFSAWQAVSGDKTSVFDVDPLLKSTRLQQPDLHLKSSSPAIGTGLIFQGYVRGMFDIDGDKRCDNHRINIGADQ